MVLFVPGNAPKRRSFSEKAKALLRVIPGERRNPVPLPDRKKPALGGFFLRSKALNPGSPLRSQTTRTRHCMVVFPAQAAIQGLCGVFENKKPACWAGF